MAKKDSLLIEEVIKMSFNYYYKPPLFYEDFMEKRGKKMATNLKDNLEKMKEEQSKVRNFWSKEELKILNTLIDSDITSPTVIHNFGYLKNRSSMAISIKISQIKRGA